MSIKLSHLAFITLGPGPCGTYQPNLLPPILLSALAREGSHKRIALWCWHPLMSTFFMALVNGVFLVAFSGNNPWWVFWAHRIHSNQHKHFSQSFYSFLFHMPSFPWFLQAFKSHPSSPSSNPLWFLLGYYILCPKTLTPKSMNPYLCNTVLCFRPLIKVRQYQILVISL